jgi:hypothetical protein
LSGGWLPGYRTLDSDPAAGFKAYAFHSKPMPAIGDCREVWYL